jgi:uncharacterized membrane protein YeiH
MAGTGPLVATGMGVLTGVGGGIIRDVLAREVPMILRRSRHRLYHWRHCAFNSGLRF